MAKQQVTEDVLYKTHTAIEKLSDGTCIKRITETRDGKTEVKEEKVDCETALKDVRGLEVQGEAGFDKSKDEFDKKMKEKLTEMNKSFSSQNKDNMLTKEETINDGADKTVKVTRESSSVEETKKTETIPDGTKRTLKITRESFLEETKKSVRPETILPEDFKESVKILDESFREESKEKKDDSERTGGIEDDEKSPDATKDGKLRDLHESDNEDDYQVSDERPPEERQELVSAEDGVLNKIVKTLFKVLFYPLYALGIL